MDNFDYLFNSYYNSIGKQHPRHKRGLISRPGVDEIFTYRKDIDSKILDLISETNQLSNEFIFSLNEYLFSINIFRFRTGFRFRTVRIFYFLFYIF